MTNHGVFNKNLDALGIKDPSARVEMRLYRSPEELMEMLEAIAPNLYLVLGNLGNAFGYIQGDMVCLDEEDGSNYLVLTHEVAHSRAKGDGHGSKFMKEWRRLINEILESN